MKILLFFFSFFFLLLIFLAFCCTCERIHQEPRVGIEAYSKSRGISLHATSLACVVLLDFLMLFILFGVKINESFSIICHLCGLCVGWRLVENERLGLIFPAYTVSSPAETISNTPRCYHRLLCFPFPSSSRRCFPFSANVKSISHAIRVQRRTHFSSFLYWRKEKQTSFFSFFVTHSMLLQFEENK